MSRCFQLSLVFAATAATTVASFALPAQAGILFHRGGDCCDDAAVCTSDCDGCGHGGLFSRIHSLCSDDCGMACGRCGLFSRLHFRRAACCDSGCGGCDTCGGGCESCGGCSGGCGGGSEVEADMDEGPADDAPTPADARRDGHAGVLTVSFRKEAGPSFEEGLRMYREGDFDAALSAFEAVAAAEPNNALCGYYQALALWQLGDLETADAALEQAVELESQYPIEQFGRKMERVQGRIRLWLDNARRSR